MIEITTYWNKVVRDPTSVPFGTRVLDEYEIKDCREIDNTLEDLKRRYKNHPRMTITQDSIIEDMGRYFGIHTYQKITRS